jgi:hypothetical protein
MKLLMGFQGTPLVQQPHHQNVASEGGGVMARVYVPAQVCKLLIDSLQRHREVIVCCERVWVGGVESLGISRSQQTE